MKNFINYSFTILLFVTCLIAFPFALNEVTGRAEDNPPIGKVPNPIINEGETNYNDDSDDINAGNVTDDVADDIVDDEADDVADDIVDDEADDVADDAADDIVDNEADSKDIDSEDSPEDTKTYDFSQATSEYFNDALFIGDSRTVGLSEYGDLGKASVFATNGMSVYNVFTSEISIPSIGKSNLEHLLSNNDFAKIYIMLGINELGYDFNTSIDNYIYLVDTIKVLAPDALIFLQANLHVTQDRSNSDNIFNNSNIDRFNSRIANLADNNTIFYIDINEVFDDENGNLSSKYTSDSTHVLGKHYHDWSSWLSTKAILK